MSRTIRPVNALRLTAGVAVAALVFVSVWIVAAYRPSAIPVHGSPPPPHVAPAETTDVRFLPAPGGYHTAWLVAGPLAEPIPSPGQMLAPAENGHVGAEDAAWRLVASNTSQVRLAEGGPGLVYAAGRLSGPGGSRRLIMLATGRSRVWLNGELAASSSLSPLGGPPSIDKNLDLPAGLSNVVIEVEASAAGAEMIFVLRCPSSAANSPFGESAEDAPEVMTLPLSPADNPRLFGLLAAALSLAPASGSAWISPGQSGTVKLRRGASCPDVDCTLSAVLTLTPEASPPIPTIRSPEAPITDTDLLAGTRDFPFTAPPGDYMRLDCSLELRAQEAEPVLATCRTKFFSLEGITSAISDVESGAAAFGREHGMEGAAQALLKCEKARLMLDSLRGSADPLGVFTEIAAAREALQDARAGGDVRPAPVGWTERAYWSKADNSPQPYRIYVPRMAADPAIRQDALPMIVYLHGYVPGYDKHRWVEEREMTEITAIADRLGFVLLMPFGRSNSDFASIGEVDVLAAIDAACRAYRVDPRRISLFGYSMGGYGAYLLACHWPDRFAGIVSLAGRPEPYFLEQERSRGRPREKQPRYKRYCLDVDTPVELAVNLRAVPTLICHGREDMVVPIDGARRMADLLRRLGAPVDMFEADGDHWSCWEVLTSDAPYAWLLRQCRAERPDRVTVRTYSPRFGSAFGAAIDIVDKWTEPAEITVERGGGPGQVTLRLSNVREFSVADIAAAPDLKVLGAERYDITSARGEDGTWRIAGRLKDAPRPGRWRKTAALAGPMREACNGPFTVVYDEPGRMVASAAPSGLSLDPDSTEAKARRFAREWRVFAKGLPPVACEKDLTDEDRRTRSLILFCTPSRSALLREAAPTLECRLTDTEFEVARRKVSLEGDRGLVLTRPSPWAPANDRYLVVCTGRFYGQSAADNHKLDLVPDFIVHTAGKEGEGEPPALLAGFFDSDWRADPGLVEEFAAGSAP